MSAALEDRLTQALLGVMSRAPGFERLRIGVLFLGVTSLCHLAPQAWRALHDGGLRAPEKDWARSRLAGLALDVETERPELAGVFVDGLLDGAGLRSGDLNALVHVVNDHYELIAEARPAGFGLWFDRALEHVTYGAAGAASSTHRQIAELMAQLLNVGEGERLLDPFARTGDLLAAARRLRPIGKAVAVEPIGLHVAILRLRLFLLGDRATVVLADSLRAAPEPVWRDRFERIVCDPPMGGRIEARDLFERYSYWSVPGERTVTSEAAFLRLALDHLAPRGRLVIRTPPGFLFRGGNDQKLRERLVRDDLLSLVIGLPTGLISGTNIESTILMIDLDKPQAMRGRVLFVDASDRQRSLSDLWALGVLGHGLIDAWEGDFPHRLATQEEILAREASLQPRAFLPSAASRRVWRDPNAIASARELEQQAQALADRMDQLLELWPPADAIQEASDG